MSRARPIRISATRIEVRPWASAAARNAISETATEQARRVTAPYDEGQLPATPLSRIVTETARSASPPRGGFANESAKNRTLNVAIDTGLARQAQLVASQRRRD